MSKKPRRLILGVEHLEQREMLTANAFEQHAVYLINSARHDEGIAPLAINGRLLNSAGAKASDLDNCFSNLCGSKGASDWVREAGYQASAGPSELLATYFPPGTRADQAGRAVEVWLNNANRGFLLGDHREIGVGRAISGNNVYWAAHIATANTEVFLTGVVFDDANDNRQYDYDEGLSGVTVHVGNESVTTNLGGGWSIGVNPNQSYSVGVQGSDYEGTTNGTVNVGSVSREVDFISGEEDFWVDFTPRTADSDGGGNEGGGNEGGNGDGGGGEEQSDRSPKPKGRVSGRLFVDLDHDGQRSPNEQFLSDWIVYVDQNRNGTRDANETAKLTDADGRYEFRFAPRVQHIAVELKPAFDSTTNVVRSVVIDSGGHKTRRDFGVIRDNSVSGVIFLDSNRDGVRNIAESGLSGWTVFTDDNRNGVRDAGERRAATDVNGHYRFTSLQPGAVRLAVVPKANLQFSNGNSRSVLVMDRVDLTGRDFGVYSKRADGRPPRAPEPNVGKVSGRVFLDLNQDAELSAGETPLSNWRVYVDEDRNGQFDRGENSRLTDENGRYEFSLTARNYLIGIETRSEFFQVTTNQIRSVLIESGVNKDQKDFGVRRDNSISGTIVGDLLDGTQQFPQHTDDCLLAPPEIQCISPPGVSFQGGSSEVWNVFLDANRNGQLDRGERSTTTVDHGQYRFDSLIPGNYRVVVRSKAGYQFNANERSVAVVDGVHKEGIDFHPMRLTGTVRGRVFLDDSVDRLGQFDPGETVVANRAVFADLNDDGIRDDGEWWTVTNGFGGYELVVPVGVHHIRVELDSDETASLSARRSVDIDPGEIKEGKDFGLLTRESVLGVL